MDSQLGQALASVSTSNQWSLIDGVVTKITRRGLKTSFEELNCFLKAASLDELAAHGVWLFKTGSTFIVCTNPGFCRARQSEIKAKGAINTACNCSDRIEREDKYMSSHDYNGGRHACTVSTHKALCPAWRPSPSSHLHSWRRGADKAK
jgi:hypothetical protein